MEVLVMAFCFTNPSGGTSMSHCSWAPHYPHPTAKVNIVRGFFDYECGWRFVGEAASPELAAYLGEHGSTEDRRVFVSEFELVDRRDLGPLVDFVAPRAGDTLG